MEMFWHFVVFVGVVLVGVCLIPQLDKYLDQRAEEKQLLKELKKLSGTNKTERRIMMDANKEYWVQVLRCTRLGRRWRTEYGPFKVYADAEWRMNHGQNLREVRG